MKAFVLVREEGCYDSYYKDIERVYLVEEDLTEQQFSKIIYDYRVEWQETTFQPKLHAGRLTNKKYPTIDFYEWLRDKTHWKEIKFIEISQ